MSKGEAIPPTNTPVAGAAGLRRAIFTFLLFTFSFTALSCAEFKKPEPEPFFSETKPPRAQEFRWSNGRSPESMDPAKAAAPPDTDLVRAVYEGLTEIDPKTLEAIPAVAVSWEPSEENRVWTFEIRKDARWTNGDRVTAEDFVSSWNRLASMGEEVAHFGIVRNIQGMRAAVPDSEKAKTPDGQAKPQETKGAKDAPQTGKKLSPPPEKNSATPDKKVSGAPDSSGNGDKAANKAAKPGAPPIEGVKAVADHKLEVRLVEPDADFPRLTAHPVLRPVFAGGEGLEKASISAEIITNGPFRVESAEEGKVVLRRSEKYHARSEIALERVEFVKAKDADSALADYRAGKVDAVTNTEFEPLALKILTPYVDFQRAAHSALNFYEFNRSSPPFNDRRVREALAISIDRKRIADDVLEGAVQPAETFMPFGNAETDPKLDLDIEKSKDLMQKAGFPNGKGFPTIRLVINRNNVQKKVAGAVIQMWKQNLNVDTAVIEVEPEEVDTVRESGEYDLIRRGAVLPSADEAANLLALFARDESRTADVPAGKKQTEDNDGLLPPPPPLTKGKQAPSPTPDPALGLTEFDGLPPSVRDELVVTVLGSEKAILTGESAVMEVPAIPLYFPTSYSLVKPYVQGFVINALDAPLLKFVRIDNEWQPMAKKTES